ncbi:ATP-binding protein [Butyrivibrio sp. VCB2006]|uniref:ATP-binding protein n=1 Tax=Butyrivibrio sp. VCB2006 TaxID=1280679 RepID=UPI000410B643|nr:ATP-binding protein [Butyrivibrio sp. VCB2006]
MPLTNNQYNSIMQQYEDLRIRHRREREEKLQKIYETVPGYKELDGQTSTASVEFGRRIIAGEKLDKNILDSKLKALAAQKAELLKNAGYTADYLDFEYKCKDCKDTGYIGNEKCHCFKQKIIETLYDKSNLRALTEECNFANMTESYYKGEDLVKFRGLRKAAEEFIDTFNTDYKNLFIYGPVGTGKSFMTICVADELLKRGNSVIYFGSIGLFELISEYAFDFNNKAWLRAVYDDLYDCDLLVIDDLGTEITGNFVSRELFSLLEERKNRKKSTIITTNYSLEGLQSIYSDRIFSRITGNYKILKLSGPDIRKEKKLAQKDLESKRSNTD